ncbi:TPA: hypothetical protein O9R57_002634 [Staphylococcus aureus]|uniref:TcaA NTF2-like domain-containing protein n=1 Tax=Staphylococcus TaxID=1279 RepID=UPI000D1CA1D8|nr:MULTISPECIES: hypothetical protein [Staphylococcus]PTE71968.1 hypothetical protein BUY50_04260 [Staphylococcus epidermidis]RIL24076.1 hypothetical protein BUY97_07935 [Staphylococcus gallinarum]HDC9782871.1 hypothetical protein [Staphylococcus aureus]
MDYTNQKRKYIIFGVILVITLLIIGIAYYLISLNNAKGQIKEFEKLVQHNDYNSIANKLSNNEQTLSKTDAKNFVAFVKKKQNKERYNKQIKNIKSNIDQNKEYNTEYGSITDQYGNNLITVKKNGKKFFLIDKLEFKPKLTNVYVKEFNNTGFYHYKQGKNKETLADSNQTTELGKFFVGKYSIKADKTIKESLHNGTVTGKLNIDLTNREDTNKIYADEDFNQSWFKIKLNNNSLLEKDSYKVLVDNKSIDYKPQKVYGKYYTPTDLKVYVTGQLEGKEFKTNTINIRRNYKNEYQDLKLSFDKNQIEDYKKDSNELKDKAKDYIKKYVKSLNKAYNKKEYKYVSEFIKPNSELEKQLKNNIQGKEKVEFKEVNINKVERDNNKVTINLSKKIGNDLTTSKYILNYNELEKDFIIEKAE